MKKWYHSSTIWLNIGFAAILAVQAISEVFPIPDGVLETLLIVANILNRFRTTQPIK